MAFLKIQNVKINGMAAAVPKNIVSNVGAQSADGVAYDASDFIESTGVKERHNDKEIRTFDLCLAAGEKIIEDLGWDKKEIEALLLVTQTGEYILPATSCILQDRLGLSKDCYAEDIGLGCSGWVYALSNIAALMQNGDIKKALLFSGETGLNNPDDDLLFGSAGTVTALEYDPSSKPIYFNLGTDGSGFDAIIIPGGMANKPFNEHSLDMYEVEGHMYNDLNTQMKGMDVFSFGITTAPKSVKKLTEHYELNISEADYLVLHQANKKMNDMIIKKLKFSPDRAPYSLDEFGNTSSASIPLTMVTRMKSPLEKENLKIICCGFGVGLSWGACYFETDKIKISKLVEI